MLMLDSKLTTRTRIVKNWKSIAKTTSMNKKDVISSSKFPYLVTATVG